MSEPDSFGRVRGVHYAYAYATSMGWCLTNPPCRGILNCGPYLQPFISPESAMAHEPGEFGWHTDNPQWVDCPQCIEQMPSRIDLRLSMAQESAAAAVAEVERLAKDFATAIEKRDKKGTS